MSGGWKARDVGLLLLGAGVLTIAIVVAHWYFFEMLPDMNSAKNRVSTWCAIHDGKAFITIRTGGTLTDVNVYVGNAMACTYTSIPPSSSEVCEYNTPGTPGPTTYHVKYMANGKKRISSGICMIVKESQVVPAG